MNLDSSKLLDVKSVYIPHLDYKEQLLTELGNSVLYSEDSLILSDKVIKSVWAQNIWLEPNIVEIASINDAKNKLKKIKKYWTNCSQNFHRRSALIGEGISNPKNPEIDFFKHVEFPPIDTGYFALLSQDKMLYSPKAASPFLNGIPNIIEDRLGPPARAYLKLVECLMRINNRPSSKDLCLELGASPGSWTWVLLKLGAKVIAYDRSDLDLRLKHNPKLDVVLKDAFSAKPSEFDQIDWLFSDIICYPQKLFEFINLWLESGKCKNFVVTVKFQGSEHYPIISEFLKIPGSNLFHSFHNKHELTWVKLAV